MKLRRRVAAIVLIVATVVGGQAGMASTQDTPPDLRMLMNLDLFEPRHNQPSPAASPTDDSMLDQIRTLNQMGYLGNPRANAVSAPASGVAAPGPAAAASPAAEPPENPSTPAARPSIDVEGPLP